MDATTTLAFLFVGGGLLGLSTSSGTTAYVAYAGWLLLTGLGVMLALPTLSAAISQALPADQVGVGAGLQSTTREFGSALGVAIIGTVLTARFVSALPADIRAAHDPHTVAQALATVDPRRAPDVVHAFVAGADLGWRVIGIAVLVLGALVVIEARASMRLRRTRDSRTS